MPPSKLRCFGRVTHSTGHSPVCGQVISVVSDRLLLLFGISVSGSRLLHGLKINLIKKRQKQGKIIINSRTAGQS